jgi:hypothetical protein
LEKNIGIESLNMYDLVIFSVYFTLGYSVSLFFKSL